MTDGRDSHPHAISVVIPVFRIDEALQPLLDELESLRITQHSPGGRQFEVVETVLVFDGDQAEQAAQLQGLTAERSHARVVWLSRNFGQHPATLAGMSASTGEWIVTMDEDGQFPPSSIGPLLDCALDTKSPVVYGQPSLVTPHPMWRRLGSWIARTLFNLLVGSNNWARFSSFRLILGEIGRSVGAYCTNETYLDVALSWVSPRSASTKVAYRSEHSTSGYRFTKLLAHFLRMFLTLGTRPMRIFAALGGLAATGGFLLAATLVYRRVVLGFPVGFASTLALLLILTGLILLGLAVLSEYVGLIVRSAIGRPLYVVTANPLDSALYRANTLNDRLPG